MCFCFLLRIATFKQFSYHSNYPIFDILWGRCKGPASLQTCLQACRKCVAGSILYIAYSILIYLGAAARVLQACKLVSRPAGSAWRAQGVM